MVFSSLIRTLQKSPLTKELLEKLKGNNELGLKGINRLPKGLISSTLAQANQQNLLVICATLEEAGRWTAQLEVMGWKTVNFYPTTEASPYEPLNPESEMIWGQMQVLSNLNLSEAENNNYAIVTTEKALQPHLPPSDIFHESCLKLQAGMAEKSKKFDEALVKLGYERVNLVEVEGQWSRRGDIVDIFPVSSEVPVRLEWFGDELEKIREFDPSTQRSLEAIDYILLTPISFNIIIGNIFKENNNKLDNYLSEEEKEGIDNYNYPPGMQRFLGIAFDEPACILDYLSPNTLCVFDEIEQCQAHSDRWLDYIEEQWQEGNKSLPKIHRNFQESLKLIEDFPKVYLSELSEVNNKNALDLSSRPLPTTPHQFAKLAEILRGKREIYTGMTLEKYATWLISAQPSRTVSLLQEHDCSAQFIPNPRDYPAINKSQ
ncbi:MAG: transcription-repair coupling factor, partial [Crocosphaera sp.]